MRSVSVIGLAVMLLLGGCASTLTASPMTVVSGQSPRQVPERVVPLVDHHQHLLSPALAAVFNGPPAMPAIRIPVDLNALLERRVALWSNRQALARLYTPDALLALNEGPASGFLRGPDAVASFLSRRFSGPYQLTPVSYLMSGNLATVTGYYTRAGRHISYFQLTLRKTSGAWRIAAEIPTFRGMGLQPPITASDLVAMLDEAGIEKAVVLSGAFGFGSKNMDVMREQETSVQRYPKVRAENDWVAEQVAAHPGRLIAFCSFSPLEPYSLAELDRCAASGRFKGIKLHLDESGVDLSNPEHVRRVRQVFAEANRRRLPLVVHVGNNQEDDGLAPSNRTNVQTFLREVVTAAPDVPVQIAHIWGGQGFSEVALGAYADAVSAGEPGTKNLYFDVAEAPLIASQYGPRQKEILEKVAQRLRQIGLDRILYGSDGALEGHLAPAEAWNQFFVLVPLTEEEKRRIAGNVAPYAR